MAWLTAIVAILGKLLDFVFQMNESGKDAKVVEAQSVNTALRQKLYAQEVQLIHQSVVVNAAKVEEIKSKIVKEEVADGKVTKVTVDPNAAFADLPGK